MAHARGDDARRRARVRTAVLGLLLAPVVGLACSGSPGEPMNSTSGDPPEVPSWSCVPGETQPCPCEDGLEGLVTCDPQGSGFGECDCSPGAVSQGPTPTSTGTESGSETGSSSTAGPVTGDTTMGSTTASSGEPDPSTSSGAPDPTTSGSSTGESSTTT